MNERLKSIIAVLTKAEEFEVYALIGLVGTTLILELFHLMPEHFVPMLTLAVITLLAVAILRLRSRVEAFLVRSHAGTGIVFHDGPAHDIKAAFREGRDVLLSGTALTRTLRNHLSDIRHLITHGGRLRLLLLDAESPYINAAAARSPGEGGYRSNQTQFIRASLRDLDGLIPQKKGSIEIRLSIYPFSFGAILVDPDSSNASLHLRYYAYRPVEHEGPYFNLYPSDQPWYDHFRKELEAIWADAKVYKILSSSPKRKSATS
jgi:hypothetical protein